MKSVKTLLVLMAVLLCFGCAKTVSKPAPATQKQAAKPAASASEQKKTEIGDAAWSFMLFDPADGEWSVNNRDRAQKPMLPASTFKILHTLIALQSGVVKKDEVFKWDGKKYNYDKWNQDHTLESAFRYSVVWVFQRIAKRIGRDRMQNYVDLVGYGNRNISGRLDSFWLTGDLRITSRQQITFLLQLYKDALPFSGDNMKLVKKWMVRDRGKDWVLRAKSGWAQYPKPQYGWYVGWVENQYKAWFFATNVQIDKRSDTRLRYSITRAKLTEMGVIPSEK